MPQLLRNYRLEEPKDLPCFMHLEYRHLTQGCSEERHHVCSSGQAFAHTGYIPDVVVRDKGIQPAIQSAQCSNAITEVSGKRSNVLVHRSV